jgi:hypothetical protein
MDGWDCLHTGDAKELIPERIVYHFPSFFVTSYL